MGNKITNPSDFKPGLLYYTLDKTTILKFVSYGVNYSHYPNLQFEFVSGDDYFFRSPNGLIAFPYDYANFIPTHFKYGY